MDYDLFPDWQRPYEADDGTLDYTVLDHSAWHFEKTPSLVSGLLPLPPREDMTYGFGLDASVEEAVRALTRLVESSALITAADPVYVPLTDAGPYDPAILTEELLASDSDLPEVTHGALPSDWKGMGLSGCKDGLHTYRHFREADVEFLADNGFNFMRVFFGFETLRFPDYPADPRMVNENELKELDQLITWGIEHGVHIQVSLSFYLDEAGSCKLEGASSMMPETNAEWSLISDCWTMLARRYAGIPSRYLSFDLSNEIQPEGDGFAWEAACMRDMVESIRAADSGRVLLHSFPSNPNAAWMELAASLGLSVGCHPYYPENIATGNTGAGSGEYFEPCWPMPALGAWQISTMQAPLVLRGAVAGSQLSVHVGKSAPDAWVEVLVDGEPAAELIPSEPVREENGELWYGEELLSCTIPEGASEIEIWVRQSDAHIDAVTVEAGGVRTPVVFSSDSPDDPAPLPVTVHGDGTYSNEAGTVVTGNDIYRAAIEPWRTMASAYGVGFMVGEFGVFANADWNIGIVATYQADMLDLFAEQGIGWCYCELYNGRTHMMLREGAASQWTGATSVAGASGSGEPYMVVEEMLAVFRERI